MPDLKDKREQPKDVAPSRTLDEATDESEEITVAKASAKAPEETLQEKTTRFSRNIANLKSELRNKSGNPGALLAKLGDAYLEA